MNGQKDLSVIIVSWNVSSLLKKCIESIYSQTKNIKFEVFVIDNKSKDGTFEMLESEFMSNPEKYPNLNLIANNYNAGFAKANNQGIERATGKYVLLLNPDTEIIESQTLDKCINFMDENKKCGVLGCKLLNSDKSLQPSVRRFPNLNSQVVMMLKLHNLFPKISSIRKYYALDFDYSHMSSVDQVMGAFLLTRKQILDKVGNLDENFWIWFEEVDYCKRVKADGYMCFYYPNVSVIHHQDQSFKQVHSYKKQKDLNKSVLHYFKKHHSFFSYLVLLFLHPTSLFLAIVVQSLEKSKIPIKKYKKVQ